MVYTGPEKQARYVARRKARDHAGYLAERNEIRKRWQAANKVKHNAHNRVYRAIKSGVLVRPDRCASCSRRCRPEAAHLDYDQPLLVLWLCRKCHAAMDSRKD